MISGTAVAFLLLVGLWLPYLAWKSARKLGSGPIPLPPSTLFVQVIGTQLFLFVVGWFTARENGITLFAVPRWPLPSWSAAALFLAAMLATLKLRWAVRPTAQKARLYSMLPHHQRERLPYTAVALAAGISEEVVYRGVLTTLLTWVTGDFIVAALLSAAVFGFSHIIQGWRAVASVFVIGLLAQALVVFAQSLIPAMAMHATYDFIAGILIPRWYERDLATSTPPAVAAAIDR
jgi:membrane protease YdiL (CAAX protease family)